MYCTSACPGSHTSGRLGLISSLYTRTVTNQLVQDETWDQSNKQKVKDATENEELGAKRRDQTNEEPNTFGGKRQRGNLAWRPWESCGPSSSRQLQDFWFLLRLSGSCIEALPKASMYQAAKRWTYIFRCLFKWRIKRQDSKTRDQYLAVQVSNHVKSIATTGILEDNLPDNAEPMIIGRMQQSNSHQISKAPKCWIIEKQDAWKARYQRSRRLHSRAGNQRPLTTVMLWEPQQTLLDCVLAQ